MMPSLTHAGYVGLRTTLYERYTEKIGYGPVLFDVGVRTNPRTRNLIVALRMYDDRVITSSELDSTDAALRFVDSIAALEKE